MKKLILLGALLVAIVGFGMVMIGCGGGTTAATTTTTAAATTTTAAATTTTTAAGATTTTTTTSTTTSTAAAASLKITNINPYEVSASEIFSSATLPDSLALNVTFGNFRISTTTNDADYVNLLSSPITVNLFDPSALTSTGTSAAIIAPASGEVYGYLKMAVTELYFTMTGESSRDILSVMQQQNPTEDWDNMSMTILPFTYTGGDLNLNMYMPKSNIAGSTYATYSPSNGPTFTFTGGVVASSVADLTLTATPSDDATFNVDENSRVYVHANTAMEEGVSPSFSTILTYAGSSGATGSMSLPVGNWFIFAEVSTGEVGPSTPTSSYSRYTPDGVDFSQLTALTCEAGGSYTVNLRFTPSN